MQLSPQGGNGMESASSDVVPVTGIEPVRRKAAWDFKSQASASSATPAFSLALYGQKPCMSTVFSHP